MPLPWSEYCDQMSPLGLYIFTLFLVNIDQILLIWGILFSQMRSNPHFLPAQWPGGLDGGNTLIGALLVEHPRHINQYGQGLIIAKYKVACIMHLKSNVHIL